MYKQVNQCLFRLKPPLSDPVIVHITEKKMYENLIEFSSEKQKQLFEALTKDLWPGPLTTILKANFKVLDKIVTAQTDYVGIRIPKETIAQKLIQYSGLPIAAPSANLFAHVSPSQAHCVKNFQ
ncbi:DHBP synthase RibB-like alpha/beta domain [Pseudocohnilembus persalinus]|uniref:Threonylcarbamoyl-AMP synthase n=1 Tax=Pseudocohnilembus persalinus TaxID=266149 RepID=A0A0V0QGT0_PSEPJ|nr:DHBP synthase RibB-like alpha/beta domain [Pseudocohnilembus persalinus]|eukprot:KRX01328.1 DHBP synthase RibB-like alpha/beta domain [Pseudocohnilembus persalinus]